MRLKFEETTYREVANDLEKTCAWLESLGLNIDPTRIAKYRRYLIRIADALDTGAIDKILDEEGSRELINALFEATELRSIHRALGLRADPGVHERLTAFVKGPVAYSDELAASSSNRARNIGFELALGAHLRTAGLPIEFSASGDLRFSHQGHAFFVECKRPQVHHQVNSRVRGALEQLEERYRNSSEPEAARGLIAISATKIINPAAGYFRTPSQSTLDTVLRAAVERFIEEHDRRWRNPRDPRTLGCLVEFRAFAILEEERVPAAGGDISLVERLSISASDHELLQSIAHVLQDGIRP